ncbi:MAG: MBL fold metallo-hydrolase [Thermoplasmatota archaeon]|nr:MBL fold metallo-hydrolase [Candidatus Thermoplasmatota archaeon]MBU1914734.1 MBL fold metallo-hydrolase [Candidatus Thermoplasmatota archaeon]
MTIEGEFLGGGDEVGRLGILLKCAGAKMLFDYGITASDPPLYPAACPPVDIVFLTHSHLDHCGMIPWLTARYDISVVSTSVSREIAILLMEDSIKIGAAEGYPEAYTSNDVRSARRKFDEIMFGDTSQAGKMQVRAHSAGHIPGATMYELIGKRTTLITGDIHTLDTRLVAGAKPVKCDNLIMESTYSGRNHPSRVKTEYAFLKKIEEVNNRGGTAIIPSFAVGRTQEILLLLRDSRYEFWLDGMGKKVNKIYMGFPGYVRSAKKLRQAVNRTYEVRNVHARSRAAKADVVVTTSGMLDGGPVLGYVEAVRNDPRSAILLTGYQVEGSNGRKLLETGYMEFQGVNEKVDCEVRKFDFSAHAGHDELLAFAKGCSPEKIVLMHGDEREILAGDLRAQGFEVLLPKNGEKFVL